MTEYQVAAVRAACRRLCNTTSWGTSEWVAYSKAVLEAVTEVAEIASGYPGVTATVATEQAEQRTWVRFHFRGQQGSFNLVFPDHVEPGRPFSAFWTFNEDPKIDVVFDPGVAFDPALKRFVDVLSADGTIQPAVAAVAEAIVGVLITGPDPDASSEPSRPS